MMLEVGDPITVAWWDTGDRLTVSRATVVGQAFGDLPVREKFDVMTESGLRITCRVDREGTEWIHGHHADDAEDVRSLSATAMLSR